ncbi:autotransporter domain-containing protein [Rhizobium nepotum]|nr:autotransporter domain-containing protein [Rhizobium nepotum]
MGVLAGYSHSTFKVDSRSSSASVDSYHLGVCGGTCWFPHGTEPAHNFH